MPIIISLLGPTGAGKSTLAAGLQRVFESEGKKVDLIRRDLVMRHLAADHFGSRWDWLAYTPLARRAFTTKALYAAINLAVRRSTTDIMILEGGTRTMAAKAATLQYVPGPVIILYFQISQHTLRKRLWRRLRQRWSSGQGRRPDDHPLIMAGKLLGQWRGTRSKDGIGPGDEDVYVLDADQTPDEMVRDALELINSRLAS